MATEIRNRVLEQLAELSAFPGVRGALVATPSGAFAGGHGSGLARAVADDVTKTIRRMTVASATIGAPLEELMINFGPARVMALPLEHEMVLILVLEREGAMSRLRSELEVQVAGIRALLEQMVGGSAPLGAADEAADELARLRTGELGPVLQEVEQRFATYYARAGKSSTDASLVMAEQMKEWLLCCSPSPYTFPLLLDGLAQLLGDAPDERASFVAEVQGAMHGSKLWPGRALH